MSTESTTRSYYRASTSKQELSTEVQHEQVIAYCLAKGLGNPVVYMDKSTSGGIFVRQRDSGGKLMKDLRKGDHVVLSKADRMFRSLKDCVTICEDFRRLGVSLHIVNFQGMTIDLGTPIGRALLHMMACFAELEKDMISERTTDTVRKLRRSGFAVGRPPLGFKHQLVRREGKQVNIVVPDPEEREIMALCCELRRKKWSHKQIQEKLTYEMKLRTRTGGEWTVNRIFRAIRAELILQYQELSVCHADSH